MNYKIKKNFLKIIVFLSFKYFSITSVNHLHADSLPGMSIGVSLDYGIDIIKSENFKIKTIQADLAPLTNPSFPAFNMVQKLNYFYGGEISFGYMMENRIGASINVAYHQSKIDDKNNKDSFLKPTILSGMLNFDYSLDLGLILYPYVSLGAGLGRIDIEGQFHNGDLELDIKNLKKNKLIYQIGGGLLVKNFGIGYKFFGLMDINDSDTFTDLNVNLNNNGTGVAAGQVNFQLPSDAFKFNTFENKNHIVTAFMKFVI
jgi:hypothetical protein